MSELTLEQTLTKNEDDGRVADREAIDYLNHCLLCDRYMFRLITGTKGNYGFPSEDDYYKVKRFSMNMVKTAKAGDY